MNDQTESKGNGGGEMECLFGVVSPNVGGKTSEESREEIRSICRNVDAECI